MGTMLDCGPTAREILTRLASPVRNRYYYGKLLDVYHLELEQRYGNAKRWMLNRLTLGTGVLCGLDVVANRDKTQVRVSAGVAIDGWGREIVVPDNSPGIDVTQPTDDCGRPVGDRITAGVVTLFVCYHECEAEPTPALVADCPDRECENGLVRERYRLRIVGGRPRPPANRVDCAEAFGELRDGETRRQHFCTTIGDACDAPAESCVPLALLRIADGRVDGIDQCVVRPVVYSNAVLLDLIICLADRIDECCGEVPPPQTKAIEKVSGDRQTGTAGELAAKPLVARVTQGGNPVANETVTFEVASGGGAIGQSAATLGPTFDTTTDAAGEATLPAWRFGPAPGAQTVTASIASGSPASVTFEAKIAEARALPVIDLIWPTNGSTVNRSANDPVQREWFDKPRVELTFSKKMDAAMLGKPANWLRIFAVRPRDNGALVQPLVVSYGGPVANPVLPDPGFCEEFRFRDVNIAELFNTKILVLIRAQGGNIDDTDSPAHLLDADFRGTRLASLPGPVTHVGPKPWDEIWDLAGPQQFPQAVWDAIVATGATLPKSGDGTEGGDFDAFFNPVRG